MSDTNLFAGTYGNGVWRGPLSEMITSVESLSTDTPMCFGLDRNFRNFFTSCCSLDSVPRCGGGVGVAVLWAATLLTMILFRRVSKTAGALLIPYLVWVTFASILTFSIWKLNG